MKKTLIALAMFAIASNVIAKTCPPPSAIHHPTIGQNWVLDSKYIAEGWSIGVDFEPVKQSTLKDLPADTYMAIQLHPTTDYWTGICYYEVPGIPSGSAERTISIATTQPFDEKNIPQPPFTHFQAGSEWIYSCSTTSGPENCTYPDKMMPQLIKVN